jgi:hypothetical protein
LGRRRLQVCRCINGHHDENHIFLVCMLCSGKVVQKCLAMGCRDFASDPVLIPHDLAGDTRLSLAPEIDWRRFMPLYPLERPSGCPEEDLCPQGTAWLDADDSDSDTGDGGSPRMLATRASSVLYLLGHSPI